MFYLVVQVRRFLLISRLHKLCVFELTNNFYMRFFLFLKYNIYQ
jgi:hypothetical protein